MPRIYEHERIIMEAFWDLDTERAFGAGTIGPIPWSRARDYGTEALGLVKRQLRPFWILIRTMDRGFLKDQKSEHDRFVRQRNAADAAKGKVQQKGNRGTGR